MYNTSLESEAAECRAMAREFAGEPEAQFLLRIAGALEELALVRVTLDSSGNAAQAFARD